MTRGLVRRMALAVAVCGLPVVGGLGCSGGSTSSDIALSQDYSKLPAPPPTSEKGSEKSASHGASSPAGKTPQDYTK